MRRMRERGRKCERKESFLEAVSSCPIIKRAFVNLLLRMHINYTVPT